MIGKGKKRKTMETVREESGVRVLTSSTEEVKDFEVMCFKF